MAPVPTASFHHHHHSPPRPSLHLYCFYSCPVFSMLHHSTRPISSPHKTSSPFDELLSRPHQPDRRPRHHSSSFHSTTTMTTMTRTTTSRPRSSIVDEASWLDSADPRIHLTRPSPPSLAWSRPPQHPNHRRRRLLTIRRHHHLRRFPFATRFHSQPTKQSPRMRQLRQPRPLVCGSRDDAPSPCDAARQNRRAFVSMRTRT